MTHPASAPDEVRLAHAAAPHAEPQQSRSIGLTVAAVIGIVLAALALVVVAVYMIAALGAGAAAVATVLALIPLAIVFAGIRWIDKWEPEPRGALAFAFLWGAGVSIVIALAVDLAVQIAVLSAGGGISDGASIAQVVVQAPIVEEIGKGIGVLLIALVARKHFDGPVDGVVYAAVVAGGFAFSENVQYFGLSLADGADQAALTFVVRGLMSPFAHVMFTAAIGIGIGLGSRIGRGGAVLGFLVGLVPAILLHALWNGASVFVGDFFSYYLVVQVPLFLGAIALVWALRRQETNLTRARLAEYAAVGWFAPAEVTALGTPAGRRTAMAWANRAGAAPLMRRYIRDATRLAHARQRIVSGRDAIGARRDEQQLLAAVTASRRALGAG